MRPTPTPPPSRAGVVLRTLTSDERDARERALSGARVREAEERKRQEEDQVRRHAQEEIDKVEREAAAKRKTEDDARHRQEEDGRRKADEAAKKLAPKGTSTARASDEEDEAPRRTGGGPRPGFSRPGTVSKIVKTVVPIYFRLA